MMVLILNCYLNWHLQYLNYLYKYQTLTIAL